MNTDISKNSNSKDIKSFNLNFGPQHPAAHGVLRLMLQLDGEIIDKVDIHIGLLHRGTEKLIESKNYLLGLPYLDRLDYVSMLSQEHAYCLSIEDIKTSKNISLYNLNLRTLFDELTRILNHLLALACHALDIGSMSTIFWGFEEREKIMEFYERLTGARMHAAFYKPFEYNNGFLSLNFINSILIFSKEALITINEVHNILTYNKIWKQRLINIGLLSYTDILNYSLSGVMLRSSGYNTDLRFKKNETSYGSYFFLKFKTFTGLNGDSYDRYLIRINEMVESLNIIDQILIKNLNSSTVKLAVLKEKDNMDLLKKTITNNFKIEDYLIMNKNKLNQVNSGEFILMTNVIKHFKKWIGGEGLEKGLNYRSIESPKGEFGIFISASSAKSILNRLKIRSSSYFHLHFLNKFALGHSIADLVALIGTIDIVFGEVDK